VAEDACLEWLAFARSQATVDVHLADQLALYLALAQGKSSMLAQELTSHLLTNIWVIQQFLPVLFEVEPETGRVEVQGVGFSRQPA
jgi:RNA 3'-terminal phosphate cyclase